MKILHTADWHIGKSLYKYDLYDDIGLFFQDLLTIIGEEEVDVLLISGDIFDLANPSNKDKELYYQFLADLLKVKVHVVITAGNHDSARMIEAPATLMKNLNIHLVGQGTDLEKQVVHLDLGRGPKGRNEIVIAAVPFLRDRDVRTSQAGESVSVKAKNLAGGIVQHYQNIYDIIQDKHPGVPSIAMGHLHMQGASTSDSERDIPIGNLGGISVESFNLGYDYVALGHIHRPQVLNKQATIQYSGSPIALSFSERKDQKRVVLLELDSNQNILTKHIKLSAYRKLIRFSGSLDEIKAKLSTFKNSAPLKALVELHVEEISNDQTKILELQEIASLKNEEYEVVHNKIRFIEKRDHLMTTRSKSTIEELKPIDVFRSKLEDELIDETQKDALEKLFLELLEKWELQLQE